MLTIERSLKHFTTIADSHKRSSLALIACAASVYILAEAHDSTPADATEAMRTRVDETGLKAASVYRYIATAKRLVAKLHEDFPSTDATFSKGPGYAVLDAKSPENAVSELILYFTKLKIDSADKLDVYLGISRRAAAKGDGDGDGTESTTVQHAPADRAVATVADASPARQLSMFREIVAAIDDKEQIGEMMGVLEARLEELTNPRRKRRANSNTLESRVAH